MDPPSIFADLDPAVFLDADSDPAAFFNLDPDLNLEKIMSKITLMIVVQSRKNKTKNNAQK